MLLSVENLRVSYDQIKALHGISFEVDEGEIVCIIGANGAGKSTTLRAVSRLVPAEPGSMITFQGRSLMDYPADKVVSELGISHVPEGRRLFDNLTVIDNLVLSFFRAHKPHSLLNLFFTFRSRHRNDEKIDSCLETFDLQDVARRNVKQLSLGEKRRLEIAMSILAEPKILLLDEPLAGLSETEINGVLDVLRLNASKQTILIVEHKVSKVKCSINFFLIIGASASSVYGYARITLDIHIFVKPDLENIKRLIKALKEFGYDLVKLTPGDF